MRANNLIYISEVDFRDFEVPISSLEWFYDFVLFSFDIKDKLVT